MHSADDSLPPIADPRAAATITLLAVAAAAVVALMLSPPAVGPAARAPPLERSAAAPVKIVGATPRSESCDGQVWPYIEGRCLVRAAALPQVRPAETTGAAPPSAVPSATFRPAIARLQLPHRPRIASPPVAGASAGEGIEPPNYESRRRARPRSQRNWSRRPAFPFFFR
jgi:hypothetical protein